MSAKPKVRLVIFDWAGTVIDFGSQAPTAAFCELFAAHCVEVELDEVRAPMGLNKREHLLAMFGMPRIAERWQEVHQRPWNESDVDTMYHEFMPIQLRTITQNSGFVPNLLQVVSELRHRGINIGGTTGYFTEAVRLLASGAARNGFTPDANICADDVSQGRPAPWMIYRVMEQLRVYPPSAVVNVGDTVADVQAGVAAGCWSVGVCDSSSLTGLSSGDLAMLDEDRRTSIIRQTANKFWQAGCHAVVETLADLPLLIDRVDAELSREPISAPMILPSIATSRVGVS